MNRSESEHKRYPTRYLFALPQAFLVPVGKQRPSLLYSSNGRLFFSILGLRNGEKKGEKTNSEIETFFHRSHLIVIFVHYSKSYSDIRPCTPTVKP